MRQLSVGCTATAITFLLLFSAFGTGMLLMSLYGADIVGPQQRVDVPAETQVDIVNVTTNHFPDGGFADWTNPYLPSYTDENSQSRERFRWYASSPWPVSEGSRSGGLQSRTRDNYVQSVAYYRQNPNAIAKNLTIDFDWWVDNNPDPSPDYCRFSLEIWFNSGKTIEYYLSGTTTSGNYTSTARFILGGLEDAWNQFSRNVTHDYLSITEFGGVLPESLTLTTFSIYAWSRGTVSDFMRGFVDDVRIVNGTTTYVGGSVGNGNFESAGGWELSTNWGYGALSRTSVAHDGAWSMNQTIVSDGNYSYTSALARTMIRLSETNPGTLSVWYNVPEWTRASENTYSLIQLEVDTGGSNYYAYYYLCRGGVSFPYTNGSGSVAFAPSGYNQTGQWTYLQRNVWQDLSTYFSLQEIRIHWLRIWTTATSPGSTLTVLIDGLSLSSAFLNDMGYEDQGASGSIIRGYQASDWAFNEDIHLTVTGTSYAGTKAANLTIPESSIFSCFHHMAYQTFCWNSAPFYGTEQLYLDCQWRLEDAIDNAPGSARLRVKSLDNREISYIFSRNPTDGLTNTTQQGFISVDGFNTEGTWLYMHRDLVHDYEAIFGETPGTQIAYVYLEANTVEADALTLLLDEIYMYTDSPPRISGVGHSPLSPEPTEAVEVSADVIDVSVDTVLVCYRVDGGTWQEATMTPQTGSTYMGDIPAQEYGASIEYYVSGNDTYGWVSIYPADMSYLTYTVDDTVNPLLNVITPENNSEVADVFSITVEASDAGSGLAFVEMYGDASFIFNETTGPFVCALNMTEVAAGIHTFRIYAYDMAGNMAYARIYVNLTHAVITTTTTTTATTTTTTTTTTTPASTTTTTTTSTTTTADGTMLLIVTLGGGIVAAIVVIFFVVHRKRAGS